MNRNRMLTIGIALLWLPLLGVLAISAQDAGPSKYTVKVPGGLAFSEFEGYEAWQTVSISRNDRVVAAILGNAVMIDAYRAGIPGNGKPVPDGAKMAKVHWKPKQNQFFPDATVPGDLVNVDFMVKDDKRFADSGGWGYAVFDYNIASDTFTPGTAAGTPPHYVGRVFKQEERGGDPRNACCAAQMFLASGDGVVFKGAVGPWYSPIIGDSHVTTAAAHDLVLKAIKRTGARTTRRRHASSFCTDELSSIGRNGAALSRQRMRLTRLSSESEFGTHLRSSCIAGATIRFFEAPLLSKIITRPFFGPGVGLRGSKRTSVEEFRTRLAWT